MPDASNQAEIEELLNLCAVLFSGTNTLIILDDCAVSKDLKNRSNKFIELAFSGRHKGLSVWVLTQQLTSIAKLFEIMWDVSLRFIIHHKWVPKRCLKILEAA